MSFIKRAQGAAEAARARVEDVASAATRTANDPATADRLNRGIAGAGQGARDAVGMANKALRTKGSPYRIAEISITASIPPGVSFAISRLDEEPELLDAEVRTSSEIVEESAESGELVMALDGTTLDDPTAAAIADTKATTKATPGALPPSTVSRV